MTRGIRTAKAAFACVVVISVAGEIVFLAEGKPSKAFGALPVLVLFVYAVQAYRANPGHWNAPMTRGEIARAVLPLIAVLVVIFGGSIVAVLLSQ